jgi:hypothetical protein
VTGVPDERFGERVAAAVSLRAGTAADTDALREHCRGTLACYKVPGRIKFGTDVTRLPPGRPISHARAACKLDTIRRPGGMTRLTINGQPLYTFRLDLAAPEQDCRRGRRQRQ